MSTRSIGTESKLPRKNERINSSRKSLISIERNFHADPASVRNRYRELGTEIDKFVAAQ